MRRKAACMLAVVLVGSGIGVLATRASDLSDRVTNLMKEGRYTLARDILEDRQRRGETFDHETRWLRALLDTDADEFDRHVHELLQDTSATDPRSLHWLTARAIEHFAQGRYQTAADLLGSRDEATLMSDPQAPLFLAMALQALGQVPAAESAYARIGEGHPSHVPAVALRAELAARTGNWRAAKQLAETVADDADYGALARLVLAQAARAEGDDEQAQLWMKRLRRDFPGAVEGSWGVSTQAASPESVHTGYREVDAPDPRRNYALQLGAFRDRSLALRYVRRLVEQFDGELESLRVEVDRSANPPWYRVVSGSYATRPQAQRAASALEGVDLASLVLGPERAPR